MDFVLNHAASVGHVGGGQVLVNNGTTWNDLNGSSQRVEEPLPDGRVPVVPGDDASSAFIDLNGDGVPDLVQARPYGSNGAWINRFDPPVITKFPNGVARKTAVGL